mmetsp:Transcript_23643/g.70347  ORF Transcript_23643/g.70347 Transcript_23643/m.70347 type:complete len:991 (-) Transcript_23643:442-3414(-)
MAATLRHRWALLLALATPELIIAKGVDEVDFSDWLQGMTVPIPPGVVFPLPAVGALRTTSGECRNLTIGSISAIDTSVGMILNLGISVKGLGVSCTLAGDNNGSILVDLTVVDSSFAFAVRMDPWYPPLGTPQLPLPLTGPTLSQCTLELNVSDASFKGTSQAVLLSNSLPPATLRVLMGQFVQEPICKMLREMVNVNGSSAFAVAQDGVKKLLMPVEPLPEPRALVPTLDWGAWPPVLVVEDLISTQFPIFAGRYLQVLNVPLGQGILPDRMTPNVTLSLARMLVLGKTGVNDSGIHLAANGSSLGLAANLSSLQFLPTLGLDVHLATYPRKFHSEWQVSFGLNNFEVDGHMLIDRERMRQAQEALNFNHPSCMIDCARSAADPANGSMSLSNVQLDMQGGTKIYLVGSQNEVVSSSVQAMNSILAALQVGYLDSINALINGALGTARHKMNEHLWKHVDGWRPCDANLTDTAPGLLTALWVASAAFAFIALLAGLTSLFRRGKTSGSGRNTGGSGTVDPGSSSEPEDSSSSAEEERSSDDDGAADVGADADVCLGRGPSVPTWLTVAYPTLLVALGFLFLFADISLAALVNVRTFAGAGEELLGPLFTFNLVTLVNNARRAGAWLIAILSLLMSGLWPLLKLALLSVCWLVPPRRLSAERRGHILSVLDRCGKYNFLDSWFLVLSMSAFTISWAGNSTSFKVEVTPTTGFYCFLAATFFSTAMGHTASEFHRHGLRKERRIMLVRSGTPVSVVPELAPLCSLVDLWQRWLVACLLAGTLALSSLAALMVSFDAKVDGLLGQVLSTESKSFSLIGIGFAIPTSSGTGRDSGLVFLAALFLLLTMVLPLLLLAMLLALWLLPLPRRAQDFLLYTCYITDCWASMEVAALILTILAVELGYFMEFIIRINGAETACNLIQDITSSECVAVGINLRAGFFFLLLAGVALTIVPKVAYHRCKLANQRKEESALGTAKDASARKEGLSPEPADG